MRMQCIQFFIAPFSFITIQMHQLTLKKIVETVSEKH